MPSQKPSLTERGMIFNLLSGEQQTINGQTKFDSALIDGKDSDDIITTYERITTNFIIC